MCIASASFWAAATDRVDGQSEDSHAVSDAPAGTGEQPSGSEDPEPVYATEKQRKYIFAKAHEHGVDEPTLRAILAEFTGQDSTARIPRDRVDVIVEAIGLQQAAV